MFSHGASKLREADGRPRALVIEEEIDEDDTLPQGPDDLFLQERTELALLIQVDVVRGLVNLLVCAECQFVEDCRAQTTAYLETFFTTSDCGGHASLAERFRDECCKDAALRLDLYLELQRARSP